MSGLEIGLAFAGLAIGVAGAFASGFIWGGRIGARMDHLSKRMEEVAADVDKVASDQEKFLSGERESVRCAAHAERIHRTEQDIGASNDRLKDHSSRFDEVQKQLLDLGAKISDVERIARRRIATEQGE